MEGIACLLGAITGAALVGFGYHLRKDKKMGLVQQIFCGTIRTHPASEDDPWDYQLEPCTNLASVIIGNKSLCEDCFEVYLTKMVEKSPE